MIYSVGSIFLDHIIKINSFPKKPVKILAQGIEKRLGGSAAALQFCYANKQVASMIIGMDRKEQINNNISDLKVKIPNDLWNELKKANIVDERCILP